jgi:hypothetical protein
VLSGRPYEALADLWEFLDLTSGGAPAGRAASLRSATRDRRSQLLWVDGDPVKALRAWMSLPSLVLFLAGAVVSTASWAGYHHVSVGFLRIILQLLTIAGFAAAAVGGGTLWLRRVRYVNPDAFLPPAEKPKGTRR